MRRFFYGIFKLKIIKILHDMKRTIAYLLLFVLTLVVTGIKFPAFGNIAASIIIAVVLFVVITIMMMLASIRFNFDEEENLIFCIGLSVVLGLIFYFIQPSIELPGLSPVLVWVEFVVATSVASLVSWFLNEEDPTYYINIG